MSTDTKIKNNPKYNKYFLPLLSFVEMWERFSYYGMRALLVLYLTSFFGFSDSTAYSMYAVFAAIGYSSCVIFGYFADKLIGPKFVMLVGGIAMILGHSFMTASYFNQELIYLGLALIAIGTGAFKGNITNMLGICYDKLNLLHKKENGYMLFYVSVNVGGFLAGISCGVIGINYGWHYGFGLAGIGMFIGLVVFVVLENKVLGDLGGYPEGSSSISVALYKTLVMLFAVIASVLCMVAFRFPEVSIYVLKYSGIPVLSYYGYVMYKTEQKYRINLVLFLFLAVFYVAFYALEMQTAGLITMFASRNVDLNVMGWNIVPTTVESINPFSIIILGSLIGILFNLKNDKFANTRFAIGLSCIPICFLVIYLGCLNSNAGLVNFWYLFFAMVIMSLGEVLVGPFVQSRTSFLAPKEIRGFLFGVLMFAASYANVIGGFAAKYMSIDNSNGVVEKIDSLAVYQNGFLMVIKFTSIFVFLFIIVAPLFKRGVPTSANSKLHNNSE